MKNLNTILNIVIAVALVVLYILHFTSKQKSGTQIEAEERQQDYLSSMPIAYLNIDSLLNQMKMYMDIQESLNKKQQNLEANIASKFRTFEQSVNKFQDEVNKGLLTRSEMQAKDMQLADEKLKLENMHNEYLQQMQEEGLVGHRKVINYIMEYLQEYNKDKNLQYIFSYSFGSNLLYANDDLDITSEVILGLNKKYNSELSSKK